MFFEAVLLVLLVLFVLSEIFKWDEGTQSGFAIAFFVFMVIGGIILVLLNWSQLGHSNDVDRLKASQVIVQGRIDNVLSQVTNELAKYPQYEERVQRTISGGPEKGTFVTVPPDLKANTTIVQAAAAIEKYNSALYDNKQKIVDNEFAMKLNRAVGRWIVPWVVDAPTP